MKSLWLFTMAWLLDSAKDDKWISKCTGSGRLTIGYDYSGSYKECSS